MKQTTLEFINSRYKK